jgi:hypothetical protein
MIRFLFRRPKFPVIFDAQGVLIGAETPKQLDDQIRSIDLPQGEQLPVIDATGEGWVLHTDFMTVSPLTFKKHWTKKEVIEVFNKSETAKQAGLEYPVRSISSKRFDQIAGEIVKLALIANKQLCRGADKGRSPRNPHEKNISRRYSNLGRIERSEKLFRQGFS